MKIFAQFFAQINLFFNSRVLVSVKNAFQVSNLALLEMTEIHAA